MQTLFSFAQAGWDFAGENSNGTEEIWRMYQDGIAYPKLSGEFAPAGDFACPDGAGVEGLRRIYEHRSPEVLRCKSSQMVQLPELQKPPGGGILPSNIEWVACMAGQRLWLAEFWPVCSEGVLRTKFSRCSRITEEPGKDWIE